MRIRPSRLIWLLMLPLAAAPGASASAPPNRLSARAVAATVTRLTGLSPSEVTAKDLCGVPAPGHARCAAQALVLRSDHSLVRPHVRPARLRQTVVKDAGARAAVAAPAAEPPDPGTPAYLQQAYDLSYLSQNAGAGDTVAIVDAYDDPTAESDLARYRSTWGLPPCTAANGCFTKMNQLGQTNPAQWPAPNRGWAAEISLDLDAVSALCPNCHILLVEATTNSQTDLKAALATAASRHPNQISASWTLPAGAPPNGTFTFQGIAVVAASGDDGVVTSGSNYPAAFAGVTAAGGTSLAPATDGLGARGFAESAWSVGPYGAAGSGCDSTVPKPAYQTLSGCNGRAYSDLSAVADPDTGLIIYNSNDSPSWEIAGGTSLSSPLIAAYYALTGVSSPTPDWAYTHAALLNDAVSGWNGSCTITFICTAVPGYDGPTGVGSISGAVVPGAPGIGGPSVGDGSDNTYTVSAGLGSATLRGGVYPNSLDTTYWWEYGPSTGYGQQTTPVDVGSGQMPVTADGQLTGLSAGTTYHYRLVAQNSAGTSYGYDYTLTGDTRGSSTTTSGTTPQSPPPIPQNASVPDIQGAARRGVSLRAGLGAWNPSATSYSVVWQRGDASGYVTIDGATGASYTPVKADVGLRLRVIVIAHNAYGSGVAASASTVPVAASPPVRGSSPVIVGSARQGRTLTFRAPVWRSAPAATRFSVQWKRCRRDGTACRSIAGARGSSYRLARADAGHRLIVTVTAANPDAAVSVSSRPSAVVSAAPVKHRRRTHR